ncbi:hypothetical protein KL949_000380 [Ogataea haglerorum]|nr:hypothetical protein KL915_000962 [Ogataea haglerorum]KAG7711744.1 hypothetical protein KL914_000386 [Ogataea haglerorum]KAG7712517.1 hypothetical protein KL950_000388 [Ogataea haglerorum]KAG7722568.1 hypothetical protein KL913_000388 [Ogataea haglerorum]KAG7723330.1 hypothetical protein KL949_000380 [Ogataea haglerorum]
MNLRVWPISTHFVRSLHSLAPFAEIAAKFNFDKPTHTIREINRDHKRVGKGTVILNGWIDRPPKKLSSKLVFASLRDTKSDYAQLICKDQETAEKLASRKPEDVVSVIGTVQPKKSKDGKPETWELVLKDLKVLNTADIQTVQLNSLKQTTGQFPQEFRYLQLRQPYYQKSLRKRAQIAAVARSVLDENEFVEIETPLLFKSTPEGADEFLVPTRKKGQFYALPQSPQQYKQLLIASGFDRYYQLAKCFRDEDLRADRQPEFTQIDLEMGFAKKEDVMRIVETVIKAIFKETRQVDLFTPNEDLSSVVLAGEKPLKRLSYREAMHYYGIDKPDLRYNLRFKLLDEFFESQGTIQGVVLTGAANFDGIDQLISSHEYAHRRPYIAKIKSDHDLTTWHAASPFVFKGEINALNGKLGLQVGDVVALGDIVYPDKQRHRHVYENPTPLGKFRQLAIQHFPELWRHDTGLSASDTFAACWVTNFPLFSPAEDSQSKGKEYPIYLKDKYEATHHPFTMFDLTQGVTPSPDNVLDIEGEHYDLVINGVEVGGGSQRIHDAQVQRYVLKEILKVHNAEELFGHLLKALDSGCPPHAGFAVGFDRLCSMIVGSSNIRDVVAFPKTQAGTDPVVGSPSRVAQDTLENYHIQCKDV